MALLSALLAAETASETASKPALEASWLSKLSLTSGGSGSRPAGQVSAPGAVITWSGICMQCHIGHPQSPLNIQLGPNNQPACMCSQALASLYAAAAIQASVLQLSVCLFGSTNSH